MRKVYSGSHCFCVIIFVSYGLSAMVYQMLIPVIQSVRSKVANLRVEVPGRILYVENRKKELP